MMMFFLFILPSFKVLLFHSFIFFLVDDDDSIIIALAVRKLTNN